MLAYLGGLANAELASAAMAHSAAFMTAAMCAGCKAAGARRQSQCGVRPGLGCSEGPRTKGAHERAAAPFL